MQHTSVKLSHHLVEALKFLFLFTHTHMHNGSSGVNVSAVVARFEASNSATRGQAGAGGDASNIAASNVAASNVAASNVAAAR